MNKTPKATPLFGETAIGPVAWQITLDPGPGTTGSVYWLLYGVGPTGTPWVALPQFRVSNEMEWRHYVHPAYAVEKLDLSYPDAEVIAGYFNTLSGQD